MEIQAAVSRKEETWGCSRDSRALGKAEQKVMKPPQVHHPHTHTHTHMYAHEMKKAM